MHSVRSVVLIFYHREHGIHGMKRGLVLGECGSTLSVQSVQSVVEILFTTESTEYTE